MSLVDIRDMSLADEYFVGMFSHVSEPEEIIACSRRRLAQFHSLYDKELRIRR